jgi:8-oxo-dGTP pyrophosphatase MutT (NUDIX family)
VTEMSPYDADGPLRRSGTRAVRPKNAATLILIRRKEEDRDGGGIRVLMGRRHRAHDFMPDKWVFPGGRVDRCDFTAPAASELAHDVHAGLALTAPARLARKLPRALALAAVRETFEEAGLLLAKPSAPRPAVGGWRPFLEAGAAPDLAALDFIGRAVTPPSQPKRFDARFFMADAKHLLSQERVGDTGELDEIDWFTLDRIETLDLPAVTRFVLREVVQRLKEPNRPVLSLSVRSGKGRLVLR